MWHAYSVKEMGRNFQDSKDISFTSKTTRPHFACLLVFTAIKYYLNSTLFMLNSINCSRLILSYIALFSDLTPKAQISKVSISLCCLAGG